MPAKGQPGPQHNEETRKRISENVRKAYHEGRLIHWSVTGSYKPTGFHGTHSKETREKISNSRKGKCLGNQNAKGVVAWNKGKPHKVHDEKWRKAVSAAVSGKNHWNWQGGKTAINAKERNTEKYKEWRNAVYNRDNWTCQVCHEKQQRYTIIAHHIESWAKHKALRFDVNNGVTLCRKCHCGFHKPRTGTGKPPKPQLSLGNRS